MKTPKNNPKKAKKQPKTTKKDQNMNITNPPKSGPQDVKKVNFDTKNLTFLLNEANVATFNEFLSRAKELSPKVSREPGQETYRLGQFTTNRHRIGQLYASRIGGVRRFATDYAAHAFQTCITEHGLIMLSDLADDFVKEKSVPLKGLAIDEMDIKKDDNQVETLED